MSREDNGTFYTDSHDRDVTFISMPFGPLQHPSIGLSILSSILNDDNIKVSTEYFTFAFAELIGIELYEWIEGSNPVLLLGDWLFRDELFDESTKQHEYIEEILIGTPSSNPPSDDIIAKLVEAKEKVHSFINDCLLKVLSNKPNIVGFTSVFQQNVASLALAKRIKESDPSITIIFGGANCEEVMGLEMIRQFKFIDYVCLGEGESIISPLVKGLLQGEMVKDLPGVVSRLERSNKAAELIQQVQPIEDMDSIPEIDYDDFFDQWNKSKFVNIFTPSILYETSRGCWWGQKSHCTFCGLNGNSMKYRSKSPSRAINELNRLTTKYADSDVIVVDNILDMSYFDTFLPSLAQSDIKASLFYEVKSNLKKQHLKILKEANVLAVQPGIETLSSSVLKIMGKGVSGIQNIQMLKWCKLYGITPYWNFLYGFPNEPIEEYKRMADMLSNLHHLQPPHRCINIRLDRFSPNFNSCKSMGFADVKPFASYNYVYDLDCDSINNLAYYFSYDYCDQRTPYEYTSDLREASSRWNAEFTSSELISLEQGESLLIWDMRSNHRPKKYICTGVERDILQLTDSITSMQLIRKKIAEFHPYIDNSYISKAITQLTKKGLLVTEGSYSLSLIHRLEEYTPKYEALSIALSTLETEADVIESEGVESNLFECIPAVNV